MALTLTFTVTNEDGFGGREAGRERGTALGENEAHRPPEGLAEHGEGSHLSFSECAPQSLLLQTSGKWGDEESLGALKAVGQGPLPPAARPLSCPIFHFQP